MRIVNLISNGLEIFEQFDIVLVPNYDMRCLFLCENVRFKLHGRKFGLSCGFLFVFFSSRPTNEL